VGKPAPLFFAHVHSPAAEPASGKDGALYVVKRFWKFGIQWYIVVLPTTDT